MNLHGIVAPAIGAVNPFITGELLVSNGSTTNPDGSGRPAYLPKQVLPMQLQPLQFRDIQQLEGLNLQGTQRKIYINGRVEGLVRAEARGGDIINFPLTPQAKRWPYGTSWLVTVVLEMWPDWCSVAVTLQNGKT